METVRNTDKQIGINIDSQLVKDVKNIASGDIEGLKTEGHIGSAIQDIKGVGEVANAVDNVKKSIENLKIATTKSLEGNSVDGLVEDYAGLIRNQELGLQSKRNSKLSDALDKMGNTKDGVLLAESELESIARDAIAVNGLKGEDIEIAFYNAEDGNMGGHKDGKIYINMAYQDGSNERLMEVVGDELSHYVDYKKGRTRTETQSNNAITDVSRGYGNDASRQVRGYMGNDDGNREDFQARMKSLDFSETNQKVAATEGMENRTEIYLRKLDLPSPGDKAGHLFGKVTERKNGQPDYHFSLEGNVKGGEPKLNTKAVIDNDNAAFTNGGIMDQQVIEPPKGMSQSEFDELVIQNSQKYDTKAPQNQYPVGGVVGGPDARNSNTYVDNVIEESGGQIKDFGGLKAPRQNSGEVQEGLINKTVDTKYGAKIVWDKLTNGGKNTDVLKAQRDQEKAEALRKDRGFKD